MYKSFINIKHLNRSHLYWGIDKASGDVVDIDEVTKRGLNCNCRCAACKGDFIARKGEKNKHHFAHQSNYECVYANEIAIYLLAKKMLGQLGSVELPAVPVKIGQRTELAKESWQASIGEVHYQCEPEQYPPLLIAALDNRPTRIILSFGKYYNTENLEKLRIRKVWLPKTLAYILRERKAAQDELRGFLGDEYQEFNLVVALPNGRPCEDRIILKEFAKLREEAGLPKVVFHSLRHSSTTYKLKLNHGDLKATQGDTGHAEIDMITSIYAHILDEDRKVNAQKFETAFYANPDLRGVRPPEEPKAEPAALDLASLVEQLQKSSELAKTLAALISAQTGGKRK